jgi:hypothetical protein
MEETMNRYVRRYIDKKTDKEKLLLRLKNLNLCKYIEIGPNNHVEIKFYDTLVEQEFAERILRYSEYELGKETIHIRRYTVTDKGRECLDKPEMLKVEEKEEKITLKELRGYELKFKQERLKIPFNTLEEVKTYVEMFKGNPPYSCMWYDVWYQGKVIMNYHLGSDGWIWENVEEKN